MVLDKIHFKTSDTKCPIMISVEAEARGWQVTQNTIRSNGLTFWCMSNGNCLAYDKGNHKYVESRWL